MSGARPARLAHLDGLRCVAVLGALLFHYFVRWTPPKNPVSLYPYDSMLASRVLWYGQYGVELFFVISGFVIAMTLERCATVGEFAVRRYSRLAPAMLFCATVTWLVLGLVPAAPFPTQAGWFLSSLTFLDPDDLNRLFDTSRWQSIDGVYWTLYVEVKFYVLAACAYFAGRRMFPWTLCGIAVAGLALKALHQPTLSVLADALLIPGFLPWFLVGIGFYLRHKDGRWRRAAAVAGIGVALLLVWSRRTGNPPLEVALGVPALFLLGAQWPALRRLLSLPAFTMVGVASYSLYLVHQHAGVALIHWGRVAGLGRGAGLLLAFAVTVVMILFAVSSWRWVEMPAGAFLRRLLLPRNARPKVPAGKL